MSISETVRTLTYTRGSCSSDMRLVASVTFAREITDGVGARVTRDIEQSTFIDICTHGASLPPIITGK